jgi:hypothetical protein
MALQRYFLNFPRYANRKGPVIAPSQTLIEYAALIVHFEMYADDPFFWAISKDEVQITPEGEDSYIIPLDEPITSLILWGLRASLHYDRGHTCRNLDPLERHNSIIQRVLGNNPANGAMTGIKVNGKLYPKKMAGTFSHYICGGDRSEEMIERYIPGC